MKVHASWKVWVAVAACATFAVCLVLPVRVLTPGPVLGLSSNDTTYSAPLSVPTVYVSSTSLAASLSCQLTQSCQPVRSTSFPTIPDPGSDRKAALSVPGVTQAKLDEVSQVSVSARGYSSELAFALYYVTAALGTPLTCPVSASATVTEDGQLGPVVGVELKASQLPPGSVFVTFAAAPLSKDANVVTVSSLREAYDELVRRGCIAQTRTG